MIRFLRFIAFLLVPATIFAQTINTDRLRNELQHSQSDSTRFSITFTLTNYYLERNWDSALYYADQCITLAEKNDKPLSLAYSLGVKGYILYHLGRNAESYSYFLKASRLAEDTPGENNTWLSYSFFNIPPEKMRGFVLANMYQDWGILMGDIDEKEQLQHYYDAARIAKENGLSDIRGHVYRTIAAALLKQNQIDSAKAYAENAIRLLNQTNSKFYLYTVYLTLGEIYMKKGENKMGIQYFQMAVLNSIETHSLRGLSRSYQNLTNYYLEEKQKDSCLYYARLNIQVLHSMKSNDLEAAYSDLYKSFQLSNQVDSAYKYQGLAIKYKDSTYGARLKNYMTLQKESFSEKQRLDELQQEKSRGKAKTIMYAMLAGIVVFIVIVFLQYNNNRQKKKANQVLAKTLNDLKSTQAQLIQSEKMASLGELTAGIAHEIQNPLNFVNNFSEVSTELVDEMNEEITKGNLEDAKEIANDLKQNLEKINHHGKRAGDIVKGMLQHSRTSSGQKEPTDINALCDEYLRLAYHGLRAKEKTFNAEMKTNFDETIGNMNVVPQDIGRVILNLITNAFYAVNEKKKAADENYQPVVSIQTKKLNDAIEICVKDNGNGIPENIKDKIFQPFFTTKPTGSGTGLGLSLGYDIIKAHGGGIKVESKEGEGTEFFILLPI